MWQLTAILPNGITVAHDLIVRENSAGQPCQPAMMSAQMSQFSVAFAVSRQLVITAQIGRDTRVIPCWRSSRLATMVWAGASIAVLADCILSPERIRAPATATRS